ncbi:torsin-1A [Danaus plexippus]|uniref:Torsin family protein n=1 Tax=Danaus plexippus plexippus TaxID=278856 RepID=A0A212F0X6_DANPL|nr:torsin-1A [Danaus plexippus]OWR47382.1 putative Torsin family protein [Danaus plexippus plexippus]
MNIKGCLFFILQLKVVSSELVTSLIIGTTAVSGFFGWDYIKSNTYCRYVECCNDNYVNFDIEKLEQSLKNQLFGQPLVNELPKILKAHKESLKDKTQKNKKALVLSLHGWSGVGKNYATTFIAEAIFKKGMKSQFVKVFMGKKDFDCSNLQESQRKLINEVNNIVKKCSTSLIIFDEIHEMCPTILDSIKPMLDHHHEVDGVDYRNAIFIFISNIGGKEIATSLLDLYSQGITRNNVEFYNFESIIRRTAYNTGGFEKSLTIAQHLIDHYIPFLPLEQHHVQMCASAEFRAHGIYNPSDDMMSDALSVITYGPSEEQPIFANNGCKRFTKQIPYIIQKHKQKNDEL